MYRQVIAVSNTYNSIEIESVEEGDKKNPSHNPSKTNIPRNKRIKINVC